MRLNALLYENGPFNCWVTIVDYPKVTWKAMGSAEVRQVQGENGVPQSRLKWTVGGNIKLLIIMLHELT